MNSVGTGGTGWVETGPGVLRNAHLGDVKVRGVYYRFESAGAMAPPYVVTGEIRTLSMMDPPIFLDGTRPDFTPSLVFHPMYESSDTTANGNDENVLIRIGGYQEAPGRVGVSAELRAERPNRPYGVRTGYQSRIIGKPGHPVWDGAWHTFRVVVFSHARYLLWWDDVLCADIVEKSPATMSGLNRFGLRCDFTDIEIRNFTWGTFTPPVSNEEPVLTLWRPEGFKNVYLIGGPEIIHVDGALFKSHSDRGVPSVSGPPHYGPLFRVLSAGYTSITRENGERVDLAAYIQTLEQ